MEHIRELTEFEEINVERRILKDRDNPFESMSDVVFYQRFRFTKECAHFIYGQIDEPLRVHSGRGISVPPVLQFLGTLRFYATGSFQSVVGELLNISQPTTSRMIVQISKLIAAKRVEFIQFPVGNSQIANQRKFREMGGIPGIVGAIDCTHIKIPSPGGPNAELYRNRKGYFSINVQAVCDSELKFTDIVARWPGSVHDSRIFANSRICAKFENGDFSGMLLGDAGYALSTYLLTPFINAQTRPHQRFNYAHSRTRNVIERTFGVWKKRFPCLATGLRLKIETVLIVIVATAVLHNIAGCFNLLDFDAKEGGMSDNNNNNDDNNNDEDMRQPPNRFGVAVRNTILQQHFRI